MMGSSRSPLPSVAQWSQLVALVQQCGASVAADLEKLRKEQDRAASTLASLAVVQSDHDRREEQIKGTEAQISAAETALKTRAAAIAEREAEVTRLEAASTDEASRLGAWNKLLESTHDHLLDQSTITNRLLSEAQERAAWLVTDAHTQAKQITGSAETAAALEKANLDADLDERRKQAATEIDAQWARLRVAQEQFDRRQAAAREVTTRQLRALLEE